MESLDLDVLREARDWLAAGHRVTLLTLVRTFGSAPRPPGALLALRDDGRLAGSVSGGCVEDELIARVRRGELVQRPERITFGITRDEAQRYGLPCGGTLELVAEPLHDAAWLDELLARCAAHQLTARLLDVDSGVVSLDAAERGESLHFDGRHLRSIFGPRWRLLLIGAGQISRVLAQMAPALGYEVRVSDPREEYNAGWDAAHGRCLPDMPDDVVRELPADAHTAIVALTHDPKLDDMALLEALKSPAFYVGALGSRHNQATRRERLALFDLSAAQLDRLHGPVGLHIGSRTPAEIAVSILAEMTAVKNGVMVNGPPLATNPADAACIT